jgi:ubiquinone/menaquinone biosynthesis C-methylase UbiE
MPSTNSLASDSVLRFSGFAESYDQYRPTPPSVVADALAGLSGGGRPQLVVDIGCGTGLATRLWAGKANRIIGIEPSDDMRRQAEAMTGFPEVAYQAGYSHQTNLPGACADIVTVSNALHWMEPAATFAEVVRILRPGGIFAAIDCEWPPTMPNWGAMELFRQVFQELRKIESSHGVDGLAGQVSEWHVSGHLERIRGSGLFTFTKEMMFHAVADGNAERLIGLLLSFGSIQTDLKHPALHADVRALIERTRREAHELLGDELRSWYFSYRVKVGVRP